MLMFEFPKSCRLRKRLEYLALSQRATVFKGDVLSIYWQRTKLPITRLGITVTKKYGNAVERNRFKRLVKESFRLCRHLIPTGIDCCVRPKGTVKAGSSQKPLSFAEVDNDFAAFCSKFAPAPDGQNGPIA